MLNSITFNQAIHIYLVLVDLVANNYTHVDFDNKCSKINFYYIFGNFVGCSFLTHKFAAMENVQTSEQFLADFNGAIKRWKKCYERGILIS
jgi:hypothetical protein